MRKLFATVNRDRGERALDLGANTASGVLSPTPESAGLRITNKHRPWLSPRPFLFTGGSEARRTPTTTCLDKLKREPEKEINWEANVVLVALETA